MKTKIGILVLALCTTFFNSQAQRTVTTTRATSNDISDNLDLDAVASIFGDSENLEDFERRLNDPDNRISNLDLNEDGYIDYLRVVENSSDRNSLVVIQAVLDNDVFQDVATIEVERVQNGNPRIQIVGDAYIYGSNYIIEPDFIRTPLIFSFFWGPRYITWHSPYYWNNYPGWYSYYRPYSPFKYRRHIYGHINVQNTYRRTNNQNIHFSGDNYDHIRRNDYASKHPDRSFVNRHEGLGNRNELIERRSNRSGNDDRNNNPRSNSRVRPVSPNSGSGNYDRERSGNEYSRPIFQKKSGEIRNRENTGNSTRNKPMFNNRQEQKKNENRNESYNKRQNSSNRSVTTPERPTNRVESTKGSSAPREKSSSVSDRSMTNREVKQSQPSTKKTESSKKEEKKETNDRRRRE